MKGKWLTVPLVALFLLFSTGAAAAPDCHVASTIQPASKSEAVSSHAGHSHNYSPQITTSAVSNSQEILLSVGSTLSNEICIVIGFIVLLLLRFSRGTRSILMAKQFSPPKYQLPPSLFKNLGYLNLNHLQLGIIRI